METNVGATVGADELRRRAKTGSDMLGAVANQLRSGAQLVEAIGGDLTTLATEVAAVIEPLSAPADLRAIPGEDSVQLQWTDSNKETGYDVQLRINDAQWVDAAHPGPNATSVRLDGLEPNTEYEARIRATIEGAPDEGGEYSAWTSATFRTSELPKPNPIPAGPRCDATSAMSIVQDGIRFEFDAPMRVGHYRTADQQPFVVGSGKLVGIHCNRYGADTSGAMLNPAPGEGQAYDHRARYTTYNKALNIAKRLPIDISPGNSIVATESRSGVARPQLQKVVCLTVLSEVPFKDEFRPGYSEPAGKKSRHRLPKTLRIVPVTLRNPQARMPGMVKVLERFHEPSIEHVGGFGGSSYLATWSERGRPPYGREVALEVSVAAARMIDGRTTEGDRGLIAEALIQRGIDIRGVALHGGARYWDANGGHMQGRWFPYELAVALLGLPWVKIYFQELQQTYWRDDQTPEWGVRHMHEPHRDTVWGQLSAKDPTQLDQGEKYRYLTSGGWYGSLAAARRCRHADGLTVEQKLSHSALFAYQHRYASLATGRQRSFDGYPFALWEQEHQFVSGKWPSAGGQR